VHRNNILIYIQQNATLHSLFYLETSLHVSGGSTTHHQECKQLYLQHLVFALLMMGGGTTRNIVEQFSDKINCVTLHLVGYILEYSSQMLTFEPILSVKIIVWNRIRCDVVWQIGICVLEEHTASIFKVKVTIMITEAVLSFETLPTVCKVH
jgi:hypothetical protein